MSDAKLDFSFDARVAVQYDELRGHPPEVSRAIGTAVLREVGPMSRMLELGIGTGRIALPVAAAGCRVVGIDLSAEMLDALRRQLPGHAGEPIDLVRGDIAVLPFRAATFDAAMATHILHLVPDWKSVLGRLAEVLRPGGAILLGRDWVDPASMAGTLRAHWARVFESKATQGQKVLDEWYCKHPYGLGHSEALDKDKWKGKLHHVELAIKMSNNSAKDLAAFLMVHGVMLVGRPPSPPGGHHSASRGRV